MVGGFAENLPFATPTGQASRKNVRGKPCRTIDLAVYSRQQDPPGRNGFDPKLPESCDENEGGPDDRSTLFEKDITTACRSFFDDPEAVVVRTINRGRHDDKLHVLPALLAEKGLAVSTTQYYDTPDVSYYIENETAGIEYVIAVVADMTSMNWACILQDKHGIIHSFSADLGGFPVGRIGDDATDLANKVIRTLY